MVLSIRMFGVLAGAAVTVGLALIWIVYAVGTFAAMVGIVSWDSLPLPFLMGCMSPLLFGIVPFLLSFVGCDAMRHHLPVFRALKIAQVIAFSVCVGVGIVWWLWMVT
jgi:hypothetical protein